jgi:chemotaxis protein methyltransferase CheR
LAERFRELIHKQTGIHLAATKDGMIETRLRSRIAALGLPGVEDYFHHLFEQGGLEGEMPRIVELVTTNKTDFWREPPHFDLLRSLMVPAALRRARRGALSESTRIRHMPEPDQGRLGCWTTRRQVRPLTIAWRTLP